MKYLVVALAAIGLASCGGKLVPSTDATSVTPQAQHLGNSAPGGFKKAPPHRPYSFDGRTWYHG